MRKVDPVPRRSGCGALPSGTGCHLHAHLLSSTERSLRGVERKAFNFPSNLGLCARKVIPRGLAVGRTYGAGCPQPCASALGGHAPTMGARAPGHISPVDSGLLMAHHAGQRLEHVAGSAHMQHTRVCDSACQLSLGLHLTGLPCGPVPDALPFGGCRVHICEIRGAAGRGKTIISPATQLVRFKNQVRTWVLKDPRNPRHFGN